jgi:hypothetical protein
MVLMGSQTEKLYEIRMLAGVFANGLYIKNLRVPKNYALKRRK